MHAFLLGLGGEEGDLAGVLLVQDGLHALLHIFLEVEGVVHELLFPLLAAWGIEYRLDSRLETDDSRCWYLERTAFSTFAWSFFPSSSIFLMRSYCRSLCFFLCFSMTFSSSLRRSAARFSSIASRLERCLSAASYLRTNLCSSVSFLRLSS